MRALVIAAYAVAPSLGLWTEVAATTGARASQIARLDVADLQDGRDDPRLMMPSSKKGGGPQTRRAPPGADPAKLGGEAAGGRRKAPERRSAADPARRHALERQRSPSSVCRSGGAGRARRHDQPIRCAILRSSAHCWPGCRSGWSQQATTPPWGCWKRPIAPISSSTPMPSAGARCSTWRCGHEARPAPPARRSKARTGSHTPPRSQDAINRFQSTPLDDSVS